MNGTPRTSSISPRPRTRDGSRRKHAGRTRSSRSWTISARRSTRSHRDSARSLQLAGALGWFFHLHSHLAEGRERLTAALAHPGGDPRHRARALAAAGTIAGWTGDLGSAREPLESAIALWRELDEPVETALAIEALGWVLFACGEDAESLERFEEALELQRRIGRPLLVNRALVGVCQMLVALGDTDAAEPRANELLELARREDDVRSEHFAHHFLADCALIRGDAATADERYRLSLQAALPLGDAIETSFEIQGLGMAAAGLGYPERALRLGGAAAAIWEEKGAAIDVPFWLALLDKWFTHAREALRADEGAQRLGSRPRAFVRARSRGSARARLP